MRNPCFLLLGMIVAFPVLLYGQESTVIDYPSVVPLMWTSEPPPDCPFGLSEDFAAVLFNRKWDAGTQILGGQISFSDGTGIKTDTLPRAGRRKGVKIVMPEKEITWMKFTVTRCKGHQAGLSEIAIFTKETDRKN
jgi:hypothetical protein